MNLPLVSVIIPSYNRAHLIYETLDSIIAQSYQNWECIVVDDGSTDNTFEVVDNYVRNDERIQYHNRPKERIKGANSCRNFGFELSKGTYVNWFDSDDIMDSQCLEKKINLSLKNDTDFVSCELAYFKDEVSEYEIVKNIYSGNLFENYFCGKIAFYISGPLWRRDFLVKNDLKFKPKNKILNDWIFNLDALLITNNYGLIKEPLIFYRIHDLSISGALSGHKSQSVISEYIERKNMYFRYKSKGLLNQKVADFYFSRCVFLLRALVLNKHQKKRDLLIECIQFRFQNKLYTKEKIKIVFGYLMQICFNRGYKFLKID